MDTTLNLKKKRKASEFGSEKPSQDNSGPRTVELNGEIWELPADYDELKEIDYDDPEVQKWLADNEAKSVQLYGRITVREAEYIYERRLELEKVFPDKTNVELNLMALAEIRK